MKDITAFPTAQYANGVHPSGFDNGMAMRDYFAAKAMPIVFSSHTRDPKFLNSAAKLAYVMADAMMEARNAAQ
jgi:hypothetical protein